MRLFAIAFFSVLLVCGTSSAGVTLLVDFGPFKSGNKPVGNQKKAESSTDDFALADPQITPDAPINNLAIDFAKTKPGNLLALEGSGIDADLNFDTGLNGFGAPGGAWVDTPIVDCYIYTHKKTASLTISSLEEIEAGKTVTVAVWGGGDKPGQDTTFSITYDGEVSESKQVKHGVSQDQAFAVFTFTKTSGVDKLKISYGNPNNFAGFGGFSISTPSEPEVAEPE
ncbi:MAG: hypothetical protein AAGA25_01625 [Planctomycetota bacterium]